VFFCIQPYYSLISMLLWHAYHIISHTCWVPTISLHNLTKHVAQKLNKSWSPLMRSSRRAIATVGCLWSYGVFPLLWFESVRFSVLFIRAINILYYDIGYSVSIFCTVCEKLTPGHTYYEHLWETKWYVPWFICVMSNWLGLVWIWIQCISVELSPNWVIQFGETW
jgi:hypothetical protein